MKFKDKTLGKRRMGDPILSGMVRDALDLPRKLLRDGKLSGAGYPLDSYMDQALSIAEDIKGFNPKSQGSYRDSRLEVTRTRALNAVFGVYQWMQDNASEFEKLGTTSETNLERWQRLSARVSLIGYSDWVSIENTYDDDDDWVSG